MLISIKNLTLGKESTVTLDGEIPAEEWGPEIREYVLARPVRFRGQLQVADDRTFILTGELQVSYRGECARCLATADRDARVEIREEFRPASAVKSSDEDVNIYKGHWLDVSPILRENLVLALPQRLLCREDCLGICPVCGSDRNQNACACGGQTEEN